MGPRKKERERKKRQGEDYGNRKEAWHGGVRRYEERERREREEREQEKKTNVREKRKLEG